MWMDFKYGPNLIESVVYELVYSIIHSTTWSWVFV